MKVSGGAGDLGNFVLVAKCQQSITVEIADSRAERFERELELRSLAGSGDPALPLGRGLVSISRPD